MCPCHHKRLSRFFSVWRYLQPPIRSGTDLEWWSWGSDPPPPEISDSLKSQYPYSNFGTVCCTGNFKHELFVVCTVNYTDDGRYVL